MTFLLLYLTCLAFALIWGLLPAAFVTACFLTFDLGRTYGFNQACKGFEEEAIGEAFMERVEQEHAIQRLIRETAPWN